jgi:hypothetical protein
MLAHCWLEKAIRLELQRQGHIFREHLRHFSQRWNSFGRKAGPAIGGAELLDDGQRHLVNLTSAVRCAVNSRIVYADRDPVGA